MSSMRQINKQLKNYGSINSSETKRVNSQAFDWYKLPQELKEEIGLLSLKQNTDDTKSITKVITQENLDISIFDPCKYTKMLSSSTCNCCLNNSVECTSSSKALKNPEMSSGCSCSTEKCPLECVVFNNGKEPYDAIGNCMGGLCLASCCLFTPIIDSARCLKEKRCSTDADNFSAEEFFFGPSPQVMG